MPAVIWPDSCFIQQTFTLISSSPLIAYCRLALAAGKIYSCVLCMHARKWIADMLEKKKQFVKHNVKIIFLCTINKYRNFRESFTTISPSFWKPFNHQGRKFRTVIQAVELKTLRIIQRQIYETGMVPPKCGVKCILGLCDSVE